MPSAGASQLPEPSKRRRSSRGVSLCPGSAIVGAFLLTSGVAIGRCFFKIWKPYSEVPLRFTTSPYFGRRRATERVEAGSAHLLEQPSGPPTALGDEWDWAPGLFYRTDLGRATTSRCIVRPARGRVIFAWRHGQRDDSSVRKLAIRIREKITQARKISRVVMTADARAVWKDAYESLSQAKPGLLARFLTGWKRRRSA